MSEATQTTTNTAAQTTTNAVETKKEKAAYIKQIDFVVTYYVQGKAKKTWTRKSRHIWSLAQSEASKSLLSETSDAVSLDPATNSGVLQLKTEGNYITMAPALLAEEDIADDLPDRI